MKRLVGAACVRDSSASEYGLQTILASGSSWGLPICVSRSCWISPEHRCVPLGRRFRWLSGAPCPHIGFVPAVSGAGLMCPPRSGCRLCWRGIAPNCPVGPPRTAEAGERTCRFCPTPIRLLTANGPSNLRLGPKVRSNCCLSLPLASSQYVQIDPIVAIEPLIYERYDSEFARSGS